MPRITVTLELPQNDFHNFEVLKKVFATGEPFFVLRAQDKLAAGTVRFWANEAEKADVSSEKVENARACAHAMTNHRPQKMPD